MDKQNLKDLLKQLHQGLQEGAGTGGQEGTQVVDTADVELRSLLKELSNDIHHVLDKDDSPDDPVFAALSERSQELSAKFAAQHPKLEPVLRELGGMLEKIGI